MTHNIGTDAEISKIRMQSAGDTGTTPDSGYSNLVLTNQRLMLKRDNGALGLATSYYGRVVNSDTTTIGTTETLDFGGLGQFDDITFEATWDSGSNRIVLPNGLYFVDFHVFIDNSGSPTGTYRTLKLYDGGGSTVSVDYQPVSSLQYQKLHVSGIVSNGFSIGIFHDASSDLAFGEPASTVSDNPYGWFVRIY
jgi:hypothetical protein